MHMTCSLSPLLHAILMLLFFSKKNARAMIQEELLMSTVSDIMMERVRQLLDDRNREYQIKVFRKLKERAKGQVPAVSRERPYNAGRSRI